MQPSSSQQPRIFLVGYARAYRLELSQAFEGEGYEVLTVEDTKLAAHALGQGCPDAILMNWLPSLSFIERYSGLLPVLVASRHHTLLDVVQSLRAGAADYIRLPCYFPEILARVERAQAEAPTRRLSIGGFSLDTAHAIAHIDGGAICLTKREARVLSALVRCPERPVSREALMRAAGIGDAKSTIIESYIKQLRKRHPLLRRAIRTSYGQGYAFFPEHPA